MTNCSQIIGQIIVQIIGQIIDSHFMIQTFQGGCTHDLVRAYYVSIVTGGTQSVIRTHYMHKKLYIPVYLRSVFGPEYYAPR